MTESYVDYSQKVSNMDASQRLVLYCLGALGKPVENEVDIQKIMFLSSIALPELLNRVYTFQEYKKGPYSERINEDVAVIKSSGYLSESDFELSDEGQEIFNEIEKRVKEPLKSTVLENKEFVSGLTEDELLTFIYVIFPKYIINSEVWNDLKQDRVKNAVSMLKKGKITASQAAKIAGMGYFEFEDYLNRSKIRWKS